MTKEEIKKLFKDYTDEEFTIETIEETKIIIKFNDPTHAKDFVRNIKSRYSRDGVIVDVKIVSEDDFSFACSSAVFSFFAFLF